MRRWSVCVLLAFSCLASSARASSFLPLSGVGTITTRVFDVAPGGDAAVGTSNGPGSGPWIWTESGGSEPLDLVRATDDPRGVSANGGVVAGGAASPTGGHFAFRWTEAGGITDLGAYPSGSRYSNATGVSYDGSAIAGTYDPILDPLSGFSLSRAFRWTEAGGVQSLGTLPGYDESIASAISGDGSTVVGTVDGGGIHRQAMRWTAAGMVGLGVLPGSNFSAATDVSLDGAIAVGISGSDQRTEAVRWNGSAIESLIPEAWRIPGLASRADATDASGTVIGGEFRIDTGSSSIRPRAVVWTPDTGMQYLDNILTELGVDFMGWHLMDVTGISADGKTLVGNGHNPHTGGGGAWLVRLDSIPDIANVPEPGTAVLVLIGTIGTAVAQRRRSR